MMNMLDVNDSRKTQTLIDRGKEYNQMGLLLKRNFPRGKYEINRKKVREVFLKRIGTVDSEKDLIGKWIQGISFPNMKVDDCLEILNCNYPELFFSSIDSCVEFENKILSKTFDYTIQYVIKNLPDDATLDECESLTNEMEVGNDNFYFKLVRIAIEAVKKLDPITVELIIEDQSHLSKRDRIIKVVRQAFTFIKNNILWKNNVFGPDKYSDIFVPYEVYQDWTVNRGKLVKKMRKYDRFLENYLRKWDLDDEFIETISIAMECYNGESIIADTDYCGKDISVADLKRSKYNEENGIFLFSILGRFSHYLKSIHDTLDWAFKDAEIIAINNWYSLFDFLTKNINSNYSDDPFVLQLNNDRNSLLRLDPEITRNYSQVKENIINRLKQLYVSQEEYSRNNKLLEKYDIIYRLLQKFHIQQNEQYFEKLSLVGKTIN